MELFKTRKDLITDLREDLPELVDKFNHFVLVPFKSKKNSVVGLTFNRETENLPKEVVVKIFNTHNADNEYRTLMRLKRQKQFIPNVLFTIMLEEMLKLSVLIKNTPSVLLHIIFLDITPILAIFNRIPS